MDPSAERSLFGENFGARDPFAGEIESNFGEKVLGNWDVRRLPVPLTPCFLRRRLVVSSSRCLVVSHTHAHAFPLLRFLVSQTEHIIKPPDAIKEFAGLTSKKCLPSNSDAVQLLEEKEMNILRNMCAGWRVGATPEGIQCIVAEWKVKNHECGDEMIKRIHAVADAEDHHPKIDFDEAMLSVKAELWTHTRAGLTLNDFIVAAKVNELDFSDLEPKKKQKFWA
jgi:4a-hydroxytetrahydrobiopterin dehydratase